MYKTTQVMNKSKNKKYEDITLEDIKKVLEIILFMGIFKIPNRRMYWQNRTRYDVATTCMPFNRFNNVISVIHSKTITLFQIEVVLNIIDATRFNQLLITRRNDSKRL